MENPKRRRGISLSHHQSNTPATSQSFLNKSVYVEPQQTTRLQYPRYHLQSPSRHASAPKAKVQFAYPIHLTPGASQIRPPVRQVELKQDNYNIPPPPCKFANIGLAPPPSFKPIQCPPEQRMTESLPLPTLPLPIIAPPAEKEEVKFEATLKLNQGQTTATIPEKYSSFEQCKQAIGKRLFGTAGTIMRRESPLQETDRGNRWLQGIKETKHECKQQSAISQTSIEQTIKEIVRITQPTENSKKKQLGIQHQVVNYVTETKPNKENAPPTPTLSTKKEGRKGRDPLKLQEMEKRLMEIIKICDENLS